MIFIILNFEEKLTDAAWLESKKNEEEEFSDFEDDAVEEKVEVEEKKTETKLQPFSSNGDSQCYCNYFEHSGIRKLTCGQ